jgi:hypothetical protein
MAIAKYLKKIEDEKAQKNESKSEVPDPVSETITESTGS